MGLFDRTVKDLQWKFLVHKTDVYFERRANREVLTGPLLIRISYISTENKKFGCHVRRAESFFGSNDSLAEVLFTKGNHEPVTLPEEEFHQKIKINSFSDVTSLMQELPFIWRKVWAD